MSVPTGRSDLPTWNHNRQQLSELVSRNNHDSRSEARALGLVLDPPEVPYSFVLSVGPE